MLSAATLRATRLLSQRSGLSYSSRFFSSSPALKKYVKLSDDPVIRLEQLAKKDPKRLSKLFNQATSVLNDPVFLTADTETTGIYPDKHGPHKIIELGLVASRGPIIESANYFLINPQRPIQTSASNVHGIRHRHIKLCPPFSGIAENFLSVIRAYPNAKLWFHNAPFDMRMLNGEFAKVSANLQSPFKAITPCCSLSLARLLGGENKLDDLLRRYGIDASSRQHGHGALIDSQLLAEVLPRLSEHVLDTAHKANILEDMLRFESPSSCKP